MLMDNSRCSDHAKSCKLKENKGLLLFSTTFHCIYFLTINAWALLFSQVCHRNSESFFWLTLDKHYVSGLVKRHRVSLFFIVNAVCSKV